MLSQMLKETKGYKTSPAMVPKQPVCQITIDMRGLFNVGRCTVIVHTRGWSGGPSRGEKLNGNILPSAPMKFTQC